MSLHNFFKLIFPLTTVVINNFPIYIVQNYFWRYFDGFLNALLVHGPVCLFFFFLNQQKIYNLDVIINIQSIGIISVGYFYHHRCFGRKTAACHPRCTQSISHGLLTLWGHNLKSLFILSLLLQQGLSEVWYRSGNHWCEIILLQRPVGSNIAGKRMTKIRVKVVITEWII